MLVGRAGCRVAAATLEGSGPFSCLALFSFGLLGFSAPPRRVRQTRLRKEQSEADLSGGRRVCVHGLWRPSPQSNFRTFLSPHTRQSSLFGTQAWP